MGTRFAPWQGCPDTVDVLARLAPRVRGVRSRVREVQPRLRDAQARSRDGVLMRSWREYSLSTSSARAHLWRMHLSRGNYASLDPLKTVRVTVRSI